MSRRQSSARIRNAKEFSIAFATAVTEASDNPQHWIAKKGGDSIFAVLNEIFPQASSIFPKANLKDIVLVVQK
jgi:hypothetical protein